LRNEKRKDDFCNRVWVLTWGRLLEARKRY
jgi:hypothetical protein